MTNQPDHNICFVCHRRADGLAVGAPTRLAWYCSECGPEKAKEALAMGRALDQVEKKACQQVAALCSTAVTIEPSELPDFVEWAVTEFAKAVRQELKDEVPF